MVKCTTWNIGGYLFPFIVYCNDTLQGEKGSLKLPPLWLYIWADTGDCSHR